MNQHTPPPATGAPIGHNQPADIVARLQDDHAELAAEYGLSQSHVSAIKLRRKWSHVA